MTTVLPKPSLALLHCCIAIKCLFFERWWCIFTFNEPAHSSSQRSSLLLAISSSHCQHSLKARCTSSRIGLFAFQISLPALT